MNNEVQNETEIDLLDLFFYLKKKIVIILAVCLIFTGAGLLYTACFVKPEYTANTRVYILSKNAESNTSYSDLQLSSQLLNDYIVLIKGENVTKEVVSRLNLDMSYKQLAGMISVSNPDNARVVQISITDTDARRAADIANAVRDIASKQIKDIMAVDAINLVYEAQVPQEKSGPSIMKNTVIVGMLGLAAVIGVLTVIYLLDDAIRTEEDVQKYLGLSVLGVIPASTELAGNGKPAPKKASGKKRNGSFAASVGK